MLTQPSLRVSCESYDAAYILCYKHWINNVFRMWMSKTRLIPYMLLVAFCSCAQTDLRFTSFSVIPMWASRNTEVCLFYDIWLTIALDKRLTHCFLCWFSLPIQIWKNSSLFLPWWFVFNLFFGFTALFLEQWIFRHVQGPLLLTWINFNTSMDK